MEASQEIINLSDCQLLEHLCSSNDDEHAYSLFLSRFLSSVEIECLKICSKRKIDEHIGKQIAHDTFERIRKYKSFKVDQIKLADERKAIIVYLNRISTSLFNDYHKKEKRQEVTHKTYFDDIAFSQDVYTDAEGLKRKKDLSLAILRKLNSKEQKVLLKDLEFKRHHKYLPNDVIDDLATELNVKRDTVRKIRERAIDKINKAINEINQ